MWGAEVTLVEAARSPLPRQLDREVGALLANALSGEGVAVRTGAAVKEIAPTDDGVTVLAAGEELNGDVVVVAAGVRPNVTLARDAGIALGPTGAIAVDRQLGTSIPGIWAAGDCVETVSAVTGKPCYLPLGSLANRQGRALAEAISSGNGSLGSVNGAHSL